MQGSWEASRPPPPLDWIEIPLKGNRKSAHPVFWPHKFFQRLAADRADIWINRIRGVEGAARQFWNSVQHNDFVTNHPYLPRDSWDTMIPLSFHGDGGGFNKHDSLFTLSWSSLLGGGPTMQSKFVFTTVKKSEMVDDTLDHLQEALSWSMNVLLSGETPHLSWKRQPLDGGGVPLANGYRATLCQVRGDWEFYWQLFHFVRWDEKEMMCPFCRASNDITDPSHSWTDFNSAAWWRGTFWTHDAYLNHLRARGIPIPPIFGPRGVIGLRLCCVTIDVLHCLDQGVTAHMVGNVMWYYAIIVGCFGGGSIAAKIKRLAADLADWYRRSPSVSSKLRGALTAERIRISGDWPRLKAKAAATRHLAAYALDLAVRFGRVDSLGDFVKTHDELTIAVCQLMVEFYHTINSESMQLSAAGQARIQELGHQFAFMYGRLSKMCFDRGIRLWKLSPKLHMFMHLCLWQILEWGNPRFWWVYGDEDLVGIMIHIAETVHPTTLAASVLSKWLWCVFDQLLLEPDDADA